MAAPYGDWLTGKVRIPPQGLLSEVTMGQGDTWVNGAIGAVITFIIFFVPVIGFISPLFGGGASGYLQKNGLKGGGIIGIVQGVFSGFPALALGLIGLGMGTLPLLGDSFIATLIGGMGALGGGIVILFWIAWTIYALMLGFIGGIIGGAIAE